MIFVLEGPDGSGKSTLAHALAERLPGALMLRSGPPQGDPYVECHDRVSIALQQGGHAIIDRLHRGEQVYGPILRGRSGILPAQAESLDHYLLGHGAVLVHCTASCETLRKRLIERDGGLPDAKSGSKLEHVPMVRLGFMHLLGEVTGGPRMASARWTVIDTGRMYLDTMVEGLLAIGHDRTSPHGG